MQCNCSGCTSLHCHNVTVVDVLHCAIIPRLSRCSVLYYTVAAAEKHTREGRDFTSTEAAAAGSLDLASEDLELTNLIGGGGFGQVNA